MNQKQNQGIINFICLVLIDYKSNLCVLLRALQLGFFVTDRLLKCLSGIVVHTCICPLWRQRQEGHELETSLSYVVRPSLMKQ